MNNSIIGNPYIFSLGWLRVPAWISGRASCDLFYYYVGGRLVAGNVAEPQSIGAQLHDLKKLISSHAFQRPIPQEIKENDMALFAWLIELTYPPQDQVGSEEFLAAPYAVTDKKEITFLMQDVLIDTLLHGTLDGKLITKIDIEKGIFSSTVNLAWEKWNSEEAI